MPQRSAKRLRRAHRFPGGARWRKPWAPQQLAASPLRQPRGYGCAVMCGRGLQGGSRTARCARRSR
jgi:hypothetical protein